MAGKKTKEAMRQLTKHFVNFLSDIELVQEPRFKVIIAHGIVELMVGILAECHCRNRGKVEDHRTYPHSVKLVLLNEMGVLTNAEFDRLDRLRDLRNEAAHDVEFILTREKLAPFKNLRNPLLVKPEIDMEEPANFGMVCQGIVTALWVQHFKMFQAYLNPKVAFRERLFGTTPTEPKDMIPKT